MGKRDYLIGRVEKMDPVFIVSKRRKDDEHYKTSALVGGGAVATAGGLLAGGLPGAKASPTRLADIKTAPTRPMRAKALFDAGKGGIFGYRDEAHVDAARKMKADHGKMKDWDLKSDPNTFEAKYKEFDRSRKLGKIGPEKDVIEHLKRGRRASHLVAGAGIAATAYGVGRSQRKKQQAQQALVGKSDRAVERYNGGLLGVGAATALGAHAVERGLSGQAARWNHKRKLTEAEIDKITPNHKPVSYDRGHIMDHKNNLLRDMSHDDAEKAGKLSGRRAQERYFANTYRANAKWAGRVRYGGAGIAAAGVGGLYANRKTNKGN